MDKVVFGLMAILLGFLLGACGSVPSISSIPTASSLPSPQLGQAQKGKIPLMQSSRVLEAEVEQKAYERNREGMMNMSMARFPEAIEKFTQAAKLALDYEIQNRPLAYTPVFMIAWASEKIDDQGQACLYYGRFLDISPPQWIEATKGDHAREYLDQHC